MPSLPRILPFSKLSVVALAVGIASALPTSAAPPTSPANPFNAQAITNTAVSPTNPPTAVQIRRERKVILVKNLQKLNTDNLALVNTQLTELQEKYDKLKEKLDDLDKNDKDRKDLEDELDELEEEIEKLGGLQTIFQNNFDFLVRFLANLP